MQITRPAVVAIAAATLLLCYASTIRGMANQWATDEDMGHGALVPLVVLWIVWRERAKWRGLPAQPTSWGFAVLGAGAAMHILALVGGGLFAGSVAFVVSVAGAILCLGGRPLLRAWSFPLLLTLFMLPKLDIVYSQVTLPLQLLASRIAAGLLWFGGVHVVLEGNVLDVGGHKVAVEEACNGVRYLLSLAFIGVVFAYLADPRPWMRVALLASVVPIAIVANAARVAASAWIPRLDSGMPHTLSGVLVFLVCLLALGMARELLGKVHGRCHG
jgi:exosortase